MSDEKRFKMVDGALIEMTPEEIAELAVEGPHPGEPQPEAKPISAPKEEPHARRSPRR